MMIIPALLKVSLTLGHLVSLTTGKSTTWKWSQRPGLNRRPLLYESIALPLSYAGCLRQPLCQLARPSSR